MYAASDTLDPLWKQSFPRFNWLNKPLKSRSGHRGLKNQLQKGNKGQLMNFKENLMNNELKDTELSKQLQDPGNFKVNEFSTTKELEGYNVQEYKYIGMLKKKENFGSIIFFEVQKD